MLSQLRPALVSFVVLSIITGLAYPFLVTGMAQLLFPQQANGSLIVQNGQMVGSSLIGQPFDEPGYFWGRVSATSAFPYNAAASSGSNLGPTNKALRDRVRARIGVLRAVDPGNMMPIPVDLVTSSASGLDPHISVAAARYQAARVARARHLGEDRVLALIARSTEDRQLGILGEPRINVLLLNLTLDNQPLP